MERKITRNLSLDEAAHGVYTEWASSEAPYNFKELQPLLLPFPLINTGMITFYGSHWNTWISVK